MNEATGTVTEDAPIDAPPPVVEPIEPKVKAKKPKDDDHRPDKQDKADKADKPVDTTSPAAMARSRVFEALKTKEDVALRDIIEALGPQGSYRIAVTRVEPKEVRDKDGKLVQVGGFLRNYETPVDEELINQHWGGGLFELRFMSRAHDGRNQIVTSKRIQVAGDPRTDSIYRDKGSPPAAIVASATPEQPSVVTKAIDVMSQQLEAAREDARAARSAPRDDSAAIESAKAMVAIFEKQLESANQRMAAMAAEMTAIRNAKPPEDPLKDKLLGSLIDGESGRITGLRMQHESELRQIKELHIADLKRLDDRADRDRQALQSSFDRERQSLVSSHELAMTSMSASKDMQIKVLEGQVRSLERECDAKTKEITDLRSKKDKSIVEMAKEIQVVKEVIGGDEDDKDGGFASKLGDLITNPEGLQAAGAAVSQIFRGNKPATGTPAQAQTPKPAQYKKQVVKAPDGNTYQVQPTGHLVPMRKKTREEGLDLPQIAPEHVTIAVNLLQNAFDRGADPVEVAAGNKALVPQDIIVAIRDHGIDVFMTKIAKIPPNSSLSSQEARNWLRKLAAALVG